MGCWNATCNISNLPILAGEKIVLIPLIKTKKETTFNNCYPSDNFTPLGFPIYGEYDEYGGIENATTCKTNKAFLSSLKFYYSNSEDGEYKEFNYFKKFDDFVSGVLCCHEGAFVQISENDDLFEINFMMIHYDLYNELIKDIANRIPYGKTFTYEFLLLNKYRDYISKYKVRLDNYNKVNKDINDITNSSITQKIDCLTDMLIHSDKMNLINNLYRKDILCRSDIWCYFIDALLEDNSESKMVLNETVNNTLFTLVLSYMRKGYLCDSGCGSQSVETKLHTILANFILSHIKKVKKERLEVDEEEYISEKDYVEETLFFYE